MVNPLYLIIFTLIAGFTLGLIDKLGRKLTLTLFLGILTYNTIIPLYWIVQFFQTQLEPIIINTAGFKAPFCITLKMGLEEAVIIFLANLTGLLSGVYLLDKFSKTNINGIILFLMMFLGMNGLILTRDVFNIFVFMEILSIATVSLISLEKNKHSLAAGFKYMLAGGIASAFLLIGIIFLYNLTGTLNLDEMLLNPSILIGKISFFAVFLVIFSFLIELKPFPANGWALDVYQSVSEGIVSVIAVSSSAAILFVFVKLLPLLPREYYSWLASAGLLTFFFSNLIGIKQKNAKRLLGYSSAAQIGLISAVILILNHMQLPNLMIYFVAGGFFINHFLSKAGLFWIAGVVKKDNIKDWNIIPNSSPLIIFFALFIFSLSGLPPFPGFWAKWDLIKLIIGYKNIFWVVLILLGSIFEIFYLFRWFIFAVKLPAIKKLKPISVSKELPIAIFAIILFVISLWMAKFLRGFELIHILPIGVLVMMFFTEFLPSKVKGLIAISITLGYSYLLIPGLSGLNLLFSTILVLGSIIQIISTMYKNENRKGFYPILVAMIISMGNLIISVNYIQFFFSWEIMTIASFLLILRGFDSLKASLNYIMFSMGAAFLILVGFASAPSLVGINQPILSSIRTITLPLTSLILLGLGFLIKTGALGFHIWLPSAYSESEDDFSSFMSSTVSKAGIFGFLIIFVSLAARGDYSNQTYLDILGWIGALTTFFGALMATFMEDVKKLLAYSSMSQLGYIILGFAAMNHLGWLSALHLTINHMLFKMMIFLAIAGVIHRTGTRNMYEMGGLIKKMPWSYISVLMGIIAISGVPPLSGFGSKWMMYNSLMERGWYFQMGIAFFSSAVAFLYLFRLIYTVFLGQEKHEHRNIKPAPLWLLIPQYIGVMLIMLISMKPIWVLQPLSNFIAPLIPSNISWEGETLKTSLGYWNGAMIMYVTMGVFGIPFVWLLLVTRKVQKVKQFNIVFAAERPDRPETTHFAYNMYAHYNKALGFLVNHKFATKFWSAISEWCSSTAAVLRNIYSGNGQTYILQILLYFLLLYFLMGGK